MDGRSDFSRHLRLDRGYFADLTCEFALCIPSIICTLHSSPDSSAIAEQLTEADGDSRIAVVLVVLSPFMRFGRATCE
jgi:hypothetical protein